MTNEFQQREVMNAGEAASFINSSVSTLAKWRLTGSGPVYVKLGRRVVYRRADLNQWLDSRAFRSTSEYDR